MRWPRCPVSAPSSCSSSEEPSRVIAVRIANSTATRSAPRIPERTDRERNQPLYLGGELRRDLVAEPPFLCPVVPAGGAVAAGFGGRASQIASLTATICSLTCAKR